MPRPASLSFIYTIVDDKGKVVERFKSYEEELFKKLDELFQ